MSLTLLFKKIINVLRKAFREEPMSDQQPAATQQPAADGGKINKLILQTQFIKIEITDPNILDELNTPDKYPNTLGYSSTEININKHGGRIAVSVEDKKEVLREILSGVSNKEMQDIKVWTVERK